MSTPVRQLILDNISTALSAISIAGGYKTDVATVSRAIKSWGEIGASEMPFVSFAPVGQALPTYKPNGYIDVRMPFTVVSHVNSLSGATKTADLAKLEDDIIAALNADTTRGGNAIRTNWQGSQTDEGNPDSDDYRGGSGTIVMAFEILYQRKVTST